MLIKSVQSRDHPPTTTQFQPEKLKRTEPIRSAQFNRRFLSSTSLPEAPPPATHLHIDHLRLRAFINAKQSICCTSQRLRRRCRTETLSVVGIIQWFAFFQYFLPVLNKKIEEISPRRRLLRPNPTSASILHGNSFSTWRCHGEFPLTQIQMNKYISNFSAWNAFLNSFLHKFV